MLFRSCSVDIYSWIEEKWNDRDYFCQLPCEKNLTSDGITRTSSLEVIIKNVKNMFQWVKTKQSVFFFKKRTPRLKVAYLFRQGGMGQIDLKSKPLPREETCPCSTSATRLNSSTYLWSWRPCTRFQSNSDPSLKSSPQQSLALLQRIAQRIIPLSQCPST